MNLYYWAEFSVKASIEKKQVKYLKLHIILGPTLGKRLEDERIRTGLTKTSIVKVALSQYLESKPQIIYHEIKKEDKTPGLLSKIRYSKEG